MVTGRVSDALCSSDSTKPCRTDSAARQYSDLAHNITLCASTHAGGASDPSSSTLALAQILRSVVHGAFFITGSKSSTSELATHPIPGNARARSSGSSSLLTSSLGTGPVTREE